MEFYTMTVVNVQVVKYIHGIITPYSVDEYISMGKKYCRSYRAPLLMYGIKA